LITTGKHFEKIILQIVQKHIGGRNLLIANQYGFRGRHSTTLQCMRLADHVTLNFRNKMSTAAVFLDIEKAFNITWHPGLLYKFSILKFSTSLIKLISSFLLERKFRVSVEGEMSAPPTLYNQYINDTSQTFGLNIALFEDGICPYATECKEGYGLRKIQSVLNSMLA
jgi:hypothetical protein